MGEWQEYSGLKQRTGFKQNFFPFRCVSLNKLFTFFLPHFPYQM